MGGIFYCIIPTKDVIAREKNSHNIDHMLSKVITSFWVKKRVGQLGVKDEKSLVERKSS